MIWGLERSRNKVAARERVAGEKKLKSITYDFIK